MQIYYRGGRADDIRQTVIQVEKILAGLVADPYDIVRGFKLRIANALLSQIQQDFIVKSRGGTGRDGIKWKPLDPKTIAQRRTTKAELKSLGITGPRVRGLLTPAQDAEWLKIYRDTFARVRFFQDDHTASKIAFGHAWNEMKKRGAKTKLEVLGGRIVDILRDQGLLFRSLSAGVDDMPSNEPGQVLRTEAPGSIIVGSNEKPWHHKGTDKIPSRPFWPLTGGIPPAWMPAIRRAAVRGLNVAVRTVLERVQK